MHSLFAICTLLALSPRLTSLFVFLRPPPSTPHPLTTRTPPFTTSQGMSFCLPFAYYKEWQEAQEAQKEGDLERPLITPEVRGAPGCCTGHVSNSIGVVVYC